MDGRRSSSISKRTPKRRPDSSSSASSRQLKRARFAQWILSTLSSPSSELASSSSWHSRPYQASIRCLRWTATAPSKSGRSTCSTSCITDSPSGMHRQLQQPEVVDSPFQDHQYGKMLRSCQPLTQSPCAFVPTMLGTVRAIPTLPIASWLWAWLSPHRCLPAWFYVREEFIAQPHTTTR